jgi:hypothetical protein
VHKCLKGFVIPLVACEAVFVLWLGATCLAKGDTSFTIEDKHVLEFTLVIGLETFLACLALCGMTRRMRATLVGLCVGLIVPIVTGWAWGRVITSYPWATWIFYMTSLEAWIGGLVLSVPGGIAGAVVGFLVAKRASTASAPS